VEKVALATLAGRTPSAEDARPARGGVVQREARRLTSHRPGLQATGWEADRNGLSFAGYVGIRG